jgi:hypothetical protein
MVHNLHHADCNVHILVATFAAANRNITYAFVKIIIIVSVLPIRAARHIQII